MTLYKFILNLFCMSALFVSMSAYSQDVKMVEFTPSVSTELQKVMYKTLEKKVTAYKKKYGIGLYLYYGFADLNADKKNEIIVQFHEEYDFRDRYGNVDTHIFAQTSKGLVQILETKAFKIGIAPPDYTGLKQIYVYKKPQNKKRPIVYQWDGKKQYVEKSKK